jgi:hypothetical protein
MEKLGGVPNTQYRSLKTTLGAPQKLPGRENDQEEKFKREFGQALSVSIIWTDAEIRIEFRIFCESPCSNLIQG